MQNFSSKMFVLTAALCASESTFAAAQKPKKQHVFNEFRSVLSPLGPQDRPFTHRRILSPNAVDFVPGKNTHVAQAKQPVQLAEIAQEVQIETPIIQPPLFVPFACLPPEHQIAIHTAVMRTRFPFLDPQVSDEERITDVWNVFNTQSRLHEFARTNYHLNDRLDDRQIKVNVVNFAKTIFPPDMFVRLCERTAHAVVEQTPEHEISLLDRTLRDLAPKIPHSVAKQLQNARRCPVSFVEKFQPNYKLTEGNMMRLEVAEKARILKENEESKKSLIQGIMRGASDDSVAGSVRSISNLSVASNATDESELNKAARRETINRFC